MRKIKEVLRLHSRGLAQRQIARSCSIGQSTVSEYLKAAEAAGLKWAEIADWTDTRVMEALLPARSAELARSRMPEPDYSGIHAELQKHKHLTLQLVWEEYRGVHPNGYRYSRFCELYRRWRRTQEVVLRQEHRAGEKLFVDYAGQTIAVQDRIGRTARGATVCRRARRQQLHLRRSDMVTGTGRLDWLAHQSFRFPRRCAGDRGARQPEVGRDEDVPL